MKESQEFNSRRFSTSNYSEYTNSFRFSSSASSPGYTSREQIDPSTYSFTTALKALQVKARMDDKWEILSPKNGMALNSKWNEAEKYISNPFSGEVPMECLSSRTLSARITMSAPLNYPSHSPLIHTNRYSFSQNEDVHRIPNKEKKEKNIMTRDVGIQSTPPELTSPPLMEDKSVKCSPKKLDSPKLKYETEVEAKDANNKDKEETKREVHEEEKKESNQNGCLPLSFKSLWKQKEKHKSKKKTSVFLVCLPFPCMLI